MARYGKSGGGRKRERKSSTMQSVKTSMYVLRVAERLTVRELRSIIESRSLIQFADSKDGTITLNVYSSVPINFKFSVGQFATNAKPTQKTK